MASSPRGQQQTTATESPQRYASRLKDRYSELESPIRNTTSSTSLKNSPLQPNRTSDYKLNETNKYASFEIKNEDRGEWRENSAALLKSSQSIVDEVEEVMIKNSSCPTSTQQQQPAVVTTHATASYTKSAGVSNTLRRSTSTASQRATVPHKPINTQQLQQQQQPEQQQQRASSSLDNHLPRYMQATTSFDRKARTAREEHRNSIDNPLRARSHGGITKRVGTTKVPRYQSTTSINAIHDIQNEMAPDDVYVPMAARIKMFERGLGNASNPKPPAASRRSTSNTLVSHQPRTRTTPTSSQQQQQQQNPRRSDSPSSVATVPNYARKTVSSEQKVLESGPSTSTPTDAHKNRLGVKPFHFVTSSERAAEDASSSFQEKLSLWKKKDKIATLHSHNNSNSKKRKADEQSTPPPPANNKHTKYI